MNLPWNMLWNKKKTVNKTNPMIFKGYFYTFKQLLNLCPQSKIVNISANQ